VVLASAALGSTPDEAGEQEVRVEVHDDLHERGVHVTGEQLQLLRQLRTREELGDHDITPGAQVLARHRQRHGPCRHAGGVRVLEPASEQRPHDVDVERQRQRVVDSVTARQGRLP
jgi:hypothetical protein